MSIQSINRRSEFLEMKIRAGRATPEEIQEHAYGGHFIGAALYDSNARADALAFVPNRATNDDEFQKVATEMSAEIRRQASNPYGDNQ
jgi:hypothetical protein